MHITNKMMLIISIAHIISGSFASIVMTKRAKEIRRNQIIMSLLAIMFSNIQAIYIIKKIKINK